MMEIKFRDVIVMFEPLRSTGKSAVDELSAVHPKSALTSYRIGKTLRSLRQAYREYGEHRDALIKELGEEKDGNFSIDPSNTEAVEEFAKRLGEFLELEPEDMKIYPVSPEGVDVSPGVFEVAWFMFEEGEDGH